MRLRLKRLGLIAGCLALASCQTERGGGPDRRGFALQRVRDYVEVHNRHDLGAVLAFYADEATFQLNGGRAAVRGKSSIGDLELFDVAAASHVVPSGLNVRTEGQETIVSIDRVDEHSRIFSALGLAKVTTQPQAKAFVVREDGRFSYVGQPEFNPACQAVVAPVLKQLSAWLVSSGGSRAASLTQNGQLRLTAATVPAVISAIASWRRASGWSPDAILVARCAQSPGSPSVGRGG